MPDGSKGLRTKREALPAEAASMSLGPAIPMPSRERDATLPMDPALHSQAVRGGCQLKPEDNQKPPADQICQDCVGATGPGRGTGTCSGAPQGGGGGGRWGGRRRGGLRRVLCSPRRLGISMAAAPGCRRPCILAPSLPMPQKGWPCVTSNTTERTPIQARASALGPSEHRGTNISAALSPAADSRNHIP